MIVGESWALILDASMYLLYDCFFTLAFLIALPYFLVCGVLQKKYFSSFWQRLGLKSYEPHDAEGGIWIHAVSVGEVLAVIPLARALKARWLMRPLFVSTTTQTGQALAKSRLGDIATILYFPFDWRHSVRRALTRINPGLVLIAETEIWPNFVRECFRNGVPLLLVNGRVSDRSVRRYRWIRPLILNTLNYFSALCMQSETDRERIVSLGAPPGRTEICGNLKYDLKPADGISQSVDHYRSLLGLRQDSLVVVAGSTMKGEEEQVLLAFDSLKRRDPTAILILAPRHPERFREVEQLLLSRPVRFSKRSSLQVDQPPSPVDIWLLDSMGELATIYGLADIVFIGGSLVPRGGHNILEAALFKKPVLFGPYMDNFREIASFFLSRQAAFQVNNVAELATRLMELGQNQSLRRITGENGFQILRANRGATDRILRRVEAVLEGSLHRDHCERIP